MNQADLDEMVALAQSGADPERLALLAQQYADWQANAAKQEAQAAGASVAACASIADVQSLYSSLSAGKSDKFKQHLTALCAGRIAELLGGS